MQALKLKRDQERQRNNGKTDWEVEQLSNKEEAYEVVQRFIGSMTIKDHNSFRVEDIDIKKIERVQNLKLWTKYDMCKR